MINRQRKLNIEQMEAREMMAGDVGAYVSGNTLYLNEATGQAGRDNSVVVSQIAPGRIRVTGNGTNDGTTSLINGAAFQDFNVTGGLNVKFGGGNDLVVFDQLAAPKFTNANIDLGAPPLVASPLVMAKTTGPATTLYNGPDNDNLIMWGASITGNLTVSTGIGDDWVYINSTPIGGNVSINTGAGADTAQLKNMSGIIGGSVDIQLYSSLAEKDADCAWLENVAAYGNINVRAGDGADLLHLQGATSYKDFNLDAGAGDDKMELNYVCAVDNFFAKMGEGNDTVTLTDLYVIHGKTQIDAGTGNDSISKTGAFPTQQLTQSGFEWVNGRPVLIANLPLATLVAAKV